MNALPLDNLPILSIVTFLPAAGALLIIAARMASPGQNHGLDSGVRVIALIVTVLTFIANLLALARFDPANPDFQLVEKIPWAMVMR